MTAGGLRGVVEYAESLRPIPSAPLQSALGEEGGHIVGVQVQGPVDDLVRLAPASDAPEGLGLDRQGHHVVGLHPEGALEQMQRLLVPVLPP